MRIGIDIRTLMDKHFSGVPEYSLNIIKELIKIDKENEYILFFNSSKDISDSIPKFEGGNVRVVSTRYPNKIFSLIMQKLLKKPKLDELLGVDVFFMPHMNFASFSGNAKTIITVHDLSFLRYPEFFSIKKNIWHKLVGIKENIHNFDKIIAVSENTKKDIIELCGADEKKIHAINPGILDDFKIIKKDSDELSKVRAKYNLPQKFIFYLGNIEPRKNVDGLIMAYESLIEENHDLRDYELVLAGANGWKYGKIFKKWQESKYKNKIHFLGFVDRKDKPCLYNLAEIFVYPSFYEGFGFPPLEAAACGLASIVGSNSSLGEVIGETSLVVDSYNTSELKWAMKELLINENLKNAMQNKGLAISKRYKWADTAKQTLDIINSFKVSK